MRTRSAPLFGAHVVKVFGVLLFTLVMAQPANAGGWAVTTLDPIPKISAGQTIPVGFTILQHGFRPVDLDSDVAIRITRLDKAAAEGLRFEAKQSGSPGHYKANVRFPEIGRFTWSVDQGWFGPQELGTINIASALTNANGHSARGHSAYIRFGSIAVAGLLCTLFIAHLVVRRRRIRNFTAVPFAVAAFLMISLVFVSWQKVPVLANQASNSGAHMQSGADLFTAKGCAVCHTGPDTEARRAQFPTLREATVWAGTRVPEMTSTAYLTESIRRPQAFISPVFTPSGSDSAGSTTQMPQLNLNDDEIAVLVDYLLQS